MGADLVIDHTRTIEEQLTAAQISNVDLVLSTAKTSENLGWITKVLRPFGHLSVVDMSPSLDANALMLKSASLHMEMVFSKVLHGYEVESQGDIAQEIANLASEGRIHPIATTILQGLNPETMRTAHEQVESSRTVSVSLVISRTKRARFGSARKSGDAGQTTKRRGTLVLAAAARTRSRRARRFASIRGNVAGSCRSNCARSSKRMRIALTP